MYPSCEEKKLKVKEYFSGLSSAEAKYEKIIELGKRLSTLPQEHHTDDNLVKGCQSKMYLISRLEDGKVYFEAESDSLISSGLAVLLLEVYSGESPEVILKCEPTHLQDLEINASLTMNRANGLASLHLKMRQDALKLLVASGS